jgi:hypothetical protein
MAFRDALSAAGIAALLTGQTIIGAVIETAASGNRWVMGTLAAADELLGYTGNADETAPGDLFVGLDGSGNFLNSALYSPHDSAGAFCYLLLGSGIGAQEGVTSAVLAAQTINLQGVVSITQNAVVTGEAWTAPVLTNAWVNYGGAPASQVAGYRKMADGTVMLRGIVKSGTLAAAMFTLPAGYRPPVLEHFIGQANTATAQIQVDSAGVVQVTGYDTGGSNVFVSLSGIRFSCTT